MSSIFIHETSVIDEGAVIGAGTKIWHFSHVMGKAIVGENCILGQNVMLANNVILGKGVKIQNNVSVYDGVFVEDEAFIGPSVVFTNVKVPRSFIDRKDQFLKTSVCRGATIGANATIICGVTIGAYAMIGAGAVVTKNVKAHSLVVGNPAKHVGWVSEYGQVLNFNVGEIATCSESAEKYKLVGNQLKKLS